ALHALVLPWRQRVEANLRVRLVLQRTDAPDDTSDLVLHGYDSTVQRPQGDADVTITTDAAALARARQRDDAPLVARVVGRAADKKLVLAALALSSVRSPD
ncbi:MAG: hypothetical protein Q8M22_04800, partial [Actinomycetota bacterium]|nr:hypothetical protein [Actinomycetota bacterium]